MVRIFIFSLIFAALLPAAAYAKDAPRTALTVSPAITEWLVAPGQTMQKKMLVTNTTKQPLPVSSLVQPFSLQEADHSDTAASARYDASAWLKVKDGDFILKPEENRTVTVTLDVPREATPGGHYATVYFRQLRPAGSTGAEARVGALAFITVKGKIEKKLEGESLAARWSGDTLVITAVLRNTGNVHVMPEGGFVIFDWRGNEVGKVGLPQGMVMPQTARTYHATFKSRGLGVYTVKPVLSYGNGRPVNLPTATIWTLPWSAMALGAFVMAAGWFGVYRIRGRWKRAFYVLTHGNS